MYQRLGRLSISMSVLERAIWKSGVFDKIPTIPYKYSQSTANKLERFTIYLFL